MPQIVDVEKVTDTAELQIVFKIRHTVFVEEQHCPPELEWEFEDESVHFLACFNGMSAGAGRWRKTAGGYKLERFAVLPDFRGKGIGKALVKTVLADLPAGASPVYLHAQIPAMPLYAQFGFEKTGSAFDEAGIRHYKMVLKS